MISCGQRRYFFLNVLVIGDHPGKDHTIENEENTNVMVEKEDLQAKDTHREWSERSQ